MQLESSLPRLQQPAIYPCPEPDKSNQVLQTDFFGSNFYFFLNIHNSGDHIGKNEKGGTCSTYGIEERCVYRVLVGKPEGKKPLGRPRRTCRWEDNIKMDLQEAVWGHGLD